MMKINGFAMIESSNHILMQALGLDQVKGNMMQSAIDQKQWVYCQPGHFEIGRNDSHANESPRYTIHINQGFQILNTPINQALWQSMMGEYQPSRFKGLLHPVDSVTWLDCIEFCNRLSQAHGLKPCYELQGKRVLWHKNQQGYRLPTEAEWEYAAHAGCDFIYAGSNDLEEVAWFGANEFLDEHLPQTHELKQKKPNAWGIYDMSGNVWEWCMDAYTVQEIINKRQGNELQNPCVWDESLECARVLKGGCYWNLPKSCRISCRNQDLPSNTHDGRGFRIVQSLLPSF